ncbi:MAG TPA: tetratricopeptide repeat-containing serine protease family protein [Verrucomicrobiae bacterium]|nr:tetratricopeptide repeat-containing serine protease family protein [Verrucomicrobiae bacterium]
MFIVIWHGFGLLVVAFIGCFYWLFNALLPLKSADLAVALSFICAAIPCWFVGRYLRDNHTTTVKNAKTGEKVRARQPYHALFFIPMHFWAPICMALGIYLLIYTPTQSHNSSYSQGNSISLTPNAIGKATSVATDSNVVAVSVAPQVQTKNLQIDYGSLSIEQIKSLAENGDAQAQYKLGNRYLQGEGVSKDSSKAIKWYRKAADQGQVQAETLLGYSYLSGESVPKDSSEAIKWFRKAADQGYDYAQDCLGECYQGGIGVPQDYGEAVKWYQKAAEQGYVTAQYDLGKCYQNSNGVPCDFAEAAKWFRAAADQGFSDAQLALGAFYANGMGVPQNYVESVKWFQKAADQGEPIAQASLGMSFALGKGVPQNDLEAYIWLSLAAAQGQENAEFIRDDVAKRMSREEIVEGQQRAAAFVTHKETPDSNSNLASPSATNSPTASGTGFFITDDGYLISNLHVVKDATKVRLLTSVGTIDAKVVQTDSANDIALLKADGKFSSLPIAPSKSASLGDTVFTLGFPDPTLQGFAPKLAKGEIASLSGAADDARYFQVSVPVQPGNSGGALVDARGNVIGIVSAKLDASAALAASGALPENVNYAVKSSFLLSFLESVPDADARLKKPNTADEKFQDAVKSAQDATVLVLVY